MSVTSFTRVNGSILVPVYDLETSKIGSRATLGTVGSTRELSFVDYSKFSPLPFTFAWAFSLSFAVF